MENVDFDRGKWIYVPDYYTDYRYILGTAGKKPLITIGINPSTAEPGNLDNTLKSVNRIAAANGFDSFIMFNVYPQRATKPDDLHRDADYTLHRENMRQWQFLLESLEGRPVIWAAWGTIIEKRDYLTQCLKDMVAYAEGFDPSWRKAGKCSIKGHPHHPLYLKKDSVLEEFDIGEYLEKLKQEKDL